MVSFLAKVEGFLSTIFLRYFLVLFQWWIKWQRWDDIWVYPLQFGLAISSNHSFFKDQIRVFCSLFFLRAIVFFCCLFKKRNEKITLCCTFSKEQKALRYFLCKELISLCRSFYKEQKRELLFCRFCRKQIGLHGFFSKSGSLYDALFVTERRVNRSTLLFSAER